MLETPYLYEEEVTDAEFLKLGQLSLRWSHTEYVLANCLSKMLGISREVAVIMTLPLSTEQLVQRIREMAKIVEINAEARAAIEALGQNMPYVQKVRNTMIHAVMVDGEDGVAQFHLGSKNRTYTKAEAFSIEELTNYTAHAALALRYALGVGDHPDERHPLPERPRVPDFLLS